jgi:DNA repair protein RadC
MVAPQAAGAGRCRSVLTELLATLDPVSTQADAVSLIEEFGSLSAVLSAPRSALGRVAGQTVADALCAVRDAMLHVARAEAFEGPVISSSEALLKYLQLDMATEPVERFRVLFLDAQNRLLYETVADGSIKQAPVYPREVMRRALQVGATALILVHNHPSGDPRPSRSDIDMTRRIIDAGRELDVTVHDHLVVARTGWTSFRARGLL